jgi:hypothetical protein
MYSIQEYFMREAENKGSPNILPKSKDWAAVARGIEN